jgi:hypothetical protein
MDMPSLCKSFPFQLLAYAFMLISARKAIHTTALSAFQYNHSPISPKNPAILTDIPVNPI